MENLLLQIGAGGTCAILILREVRGILAETQGKRKNGNGANGASIRRLEAEESSGAKPPEYWQAEMRKAAAEGFSTAALPILTQQSEKLTQQTAILADIRDEQRRLSDEMLKMAARQPARRGGK